MVCRFYSGTVAGAREAFICGVPAMALSFNWYSFIMATNFSLQIFHLSWLQIFFDLHLISDAFSTK